MSNDDYSDGRNAGFYGGSVPDNSSSEAMRGYYDGIAYKESLEKKNTTSTESYDYTSVNTPNNSTSYSSSGSSVASFIEGVSSDIRKARARTKAWTKIAKHGRLISWIYNFFYIISKAMLSLCILPIVIGLLFSDTLITGIGGAMLIISLLALLVFCLPLFIGIKIKGLLNKRSR